MSEAQSDVEELLALGEVDGGKAIRFSEGG
jgi:hypothetical protein